jgi:cytochrome c oxidase cbb3-type subunit 3
MAAKRKIDAATGVETTGHSWDGIEELNSPLPRWWLWTFYATIVFAIGYVIAYPALPGLSGATHGLLGWSSRGDIKDEMQLLDQSRAAMRTKISATPIQQVIADADMRQFAVSSGAALYKVNCVQCHGSGAQGSKGFPNLNDDSWLFGGTVEQIQQTIAHGVRSSDDAETRIPPDMPKFGADQILTAEQIERVTETVLQLSNQEHDRPRPTPDSRSLPSSVPPAMVMLGRATRTWVHRNSMMQSGFGAAAAMKSDRRSARRNLA